MFSVIDVVVKEENLWYEDSVQRYCTYVPVHVHVCVVFGGSDRDYWLHGNYKSVHLQIVYMCMYMDVI